MRSLQLSLAVATLIILMLPGGSVAAQGEERSIGFVAQGGMGGAFGELSELANPGFHVNAGLRLTPIKDASGIDVILRIGYNKFTATDDFTPDISFVTVGFDVRLCVCTAASGKLYLIGGGGFAATRVDAYARVASTGLSAVTTEQVPELNEDNPYLSGGLGLLIAQVGDVGITLEARATNVFGTRIKNYFFIPIQAGVTF